MSDTEKRLSILETKTLDYERRLKNQEQKNDHLNEITTYIKLQHEHNKQQDEKLNKLDKNFEMTTKVLDGINTNLLSLNHDVKQVKDKQENMDDRVGELEEERIRELKKFKHETTKLRKETVLKIITGVSITILGALALMYFGIS